MGIAAELRRELWCGEDPFLAARPTDQDSGYPNTNLRVPVARFILDQLRPRFWLELGSMLGGSLLRAAEQARLAGLDTEFVAVDPFTGDVNMWAWEKERRATGAWSYLGLRDGRPSIYDRFLANMAASPFAGRVVPILCTSLVGMRLIARLQREGRIGEAPQVIYLDSAHEEHETLLELRMAWDLLQPGGVLFGDDWKWKAVQGDVLRFNEGGRLAQDQSLRALALASLAGAEEVEGLVVCRGQWLLFKPPASPGILGAVQDAAQS